jgi:hypothetical protein
VMTLLTGVLRVLVILFLVRLVLRVVAGALRVTAAPTPPSSPGAGGDLVRDAVCNTFLPRPAAREARVGGRTVYFCGVACEEKARALARG